MGEGVHTLNKVNGDAGIFLYWLSLRCQALLWPRHMNVTGALSPTTLSVWTRKV